MKAVENLTALASSSLYTTVEDLARWVRNFDTAEIGGQSVIQSMQRRGVLNSGEQIDYAMGQIVGEYRGLHTVSHGGSWAGFRTHLIRFPGQRFAVVILSNSSSFRAVEMTKRVADVYLQAELDPLPEAASAGPPQPAGRQKPVQAGNRAEYEGIYHSPELETSYRIEAAEKGLVARHIRLQPIRLRPVNRDEFEGPWPFNTVRFERKGGQIRAMLVSAGDRARDVRFERR